MNNNKQPQIHIDQLNTMVTGLEQTTVTLLAFNLLKQRVEEEERKRREEYEKRVKLVQLNKLYGTVDYMIHKYGFYETLHELNRLVNVVHKLNYLSHDITKSDFGFNSKTILK